MYVPASIIIDSSSASSWSTYTPCHRDCRRWHRAHLAIGEKIYDLRFHCRRTSRASRTSRNRSGRHATWTGARPSQNSRRPAPSRLWRRLCLAHRVSAPRRGRYKPWVTGHLIGNLVCVEITPELFQDRHGNLPRWAETDVRMGTVNDEM